jgi:hypothetical protein
MRCLSMYLLPQSVSVVINHGDAHNAEDMRPKGSGLECSLLWCMCWLTTLLYSMLVVVRQIAVTLSDLC